MPDKRDEIRYDHLPRHIAIIMDGNGRWAKEQGQNRIYGHNHGVTAVRNTAEACAEVGIEYLTLYAFSSENWNRPQREVNALMDLLIQTIRSEMKTLQDNNIALSAIGNLEQLPEACHTSLQDAIQETSSNTGLTLNLALSYSGKSDITRAVQAIAQQVKNGSVDPESIDDSLIKRYLTTAKIPDPALLIRTSGETRISNFLLWELAYTELYFFRKNWPEFTKDDLFQAVIDYQNRERRFGMISEQI
jgi:undecaprenyl diphosphate synthase